MPRLPLLVIASIAVHGVLATLLLAIGVEPAPRDEPIEIVTREIPRKPKLVVPPPRPTPEPVPDPEPKEPQKPQRARRARVAPPPQRSEPAPGKVDAKEPPAKDTGPKVFGIPMEGTTKGEGGVALPKGSSVKADPRARRVGQGKPQGKGFKKDYRPGESAPVAVVTTQALPLRRVEAAYPERLRDLGIEGRVILELTIDAAGKVVEARVLRSLHAELDAAAKAAAKKMLFRPARVNNVPVKVKIPYTFTFVLD